MRKYLDGRVLALVAIALAIGYAAVLRQPKPEAPAVIGGDRDEHGCLIAAGYSWCDARGECERPWERYCTTAAPKLAHFSCDAGKTIDATFYPADDLFVDLVLGDERNMSIPRAISASGARYAREDESFVFWNKGDTAFITENGTTTYENCGIAGAR
ncbi:MAG TPA: MliC family protein [Candidatus Paceibacterota bacterium]|nr:MliC family protein [Candidatus Paceibacterota bacterium]